jgi:hypothetical protein
MHIGPAERKGEGINFMHIWVMWKENLKQSLKHNKELPESYFKVNALEETWGSIGIV